MERISIVNENQSLEDCRNSWLFDETYHVWCLEDVLYTGKATTPKFQRLSLFVPAEYMSTGGKVCPDGRHGRYTARTAPVVFENNAAGYMQMPHTWLGGPRDEAGKYLERGMVYVTCGSRGRESVDSSGRRCAKAPWTLVDLKTAIRFLRHYAAILPGDFTRIISVGWSAGGAMSSLLGVTGNNPRYDRYLKMNGAYMDEKDDVFAAQVYCPIIDLEHADLAYEWQFRADRKNEDSPAGKAGTMTPFQEALSGKLSEAYAAYFNGLRLKDPATGACLALNPDGRSGSGYDYLMEQLDEAASVYLRRLADSGSLRVSDYISGQYTYEAPAPAPAGTQERPPVSLGDLVSRPPKGAAYQAFEPAMVKKQGEDKRDWLTWDGKEAHIRDLDTYILKHRRRMKPCTSFDTLGMDSGENQEFGTPDRDYMHFSEEIAPAIAMLKDDFPDEYAQYYEAYAQTAEDAALEQRKFLINPMNYIGTAEPDSGTCYYRIRVGASDADTSFMVSMALALKLKEAGKEADYALVWDRPHCQADYPGEVCDWIETILQKAET